MQDPSSNLCEPRTKSSGCDGPGCLRHYELLFQSHRDVILFIDRETGSIVDANQAAVTAYGHERPALLRMNVCDLWPCDGIGKPGCPLREVGERGRLTETIHRRSDGSTFPVEVSLQPAEHAGRRILISVVRDISKRKRAENALRESEARYRALADCNLVGLMSGDAVTGQFRDANDAYLQMVGATREDLEAGRIYWKNHTPPEYIPEQERRLQEALRTGKPQIMEKEFVRPDGTRIPVIVGGGFSDPEHHIGVAFAIDISARKRVEATLRRSEERYRAVFVNSHDAILLASVEEEGKIVSANPAACRMFQYAEAELVGKTRLDLMDTAHPSYALLMESRRLGGRFEGELAYIRKDGSRFAGEVSSSLFRDADDRLLAVTVIRDITERKQVEEQLAEVSRQRAEALAQLDAIFDSAPVGIGFWDTDLRFVRVNRALAELNRLPVIDHIGKTPEELFPGIEAVRDIMAAWRRILATGEPLLNYIVEGELPSEPGRRRIWTENFFPVALAGRTVGIGATVLEITARREAEEKLQRSYEEMEQLVRQRTSQLRQMSRVFMDASDPIIIENTQGIIIDLNREAERAYGWTREELIGRPITLLFLPERHDRAMGLRRSCLAGEECRNLEGVRVDKQGRVLQILMTAFPLLDESDRVVALATIAKDITLRKQIEARLIESRQRLTELSRKSIEALEADRRAVSRELHDSIGGSLSAIKFTMEEIAERVAFSCPTVMPSLQNAIGYLSDTIKESRRISVNLRPLSLDDLGLMQTINGHLQQFQLQYGIRVVRELAADEERVPEPLKIVIFRILQEALANVARHSQAREVRVRLRHEPQAITLEIVDNGNGFDPHRQMIRDLSLGGYGLKSMQERVEISGGVFTIHSRPGEGTRVTAKFPLAP